MAGIDTHIVVTGNVGSDPELRFTPDGTAVASFNVGSTPRVKGKDGEWGDGETTWYRITAWRRDAEGVAEVLRKGDRVIVHGKLKATAYEAKDGSWRAGLEVTADGFGIGIVPKAVKPVGAPSREDDPWS